VPTDPGPKEQTIDIKREYQALRKQRGSRHFRDCGLSRPWESL